jgi:hypothetical protein
MYNNDDYEFNEMEVYGNRDQLETFMADVHGDGKSVFCLDKIFDLSEITPDRVREPFPGLVIYKPIFSRNRFPDSNAVLSDEIEYVKYSFVSYWADSLSIYEILPNKYLELKFKIFNRQFDDRYRSEIEIIEAEYVKHIHYYWHQVPWRDNSSKLMLYKEDKLKKTLQVVKEEITSPEHEIRATPTRVHEGLDDDDLLAELYNM